MAILALTTYTRPDAWCVLQVSLTDFTNGYAPQEPNTICPPHMHEYNDRALATAQANAQFCAKISDYSEAQR